MLTVLLNLKNVSDAHHFRIFAPYELYFFNLV